LLKIEKDKKHFHIKRLFILRTVILIGILGICLNVLSCSVNIASSRNQREYQLETNTEIVEEFFVDVERIQLESGTYYRNSIVRINLTVLPKSNASVEIFTSEELANEFSPALQNVTLAPGESYSKEHTFTYGEANEILYACQCTNDSNATILWIHETIHSARPIGLEFPSIISSSVLSFIVLVSVIKRKAFEKE